MGEASSMEARLQLAAELEGDPKLSNSVAVLRYSTHPNPWHPWERDRLRQIERALLTNGADDGK